MKGQIGHLLVTAAITFAGLWIYDTIANSSSNAMIPSLT